VTHDENAECSGGPMMITTDENVDRVKGPVLENRRITIHKVASYCYINFVIQSLINKSKSK
jgi:hypothetical protein